MIGLGFTLQPDEGFLDLLSEIIETTPDYYEVAPETLWYEGEDGALLLNGYFERFSALQRRTGKPIVAHGVGLSPGGASAEDAPRFARWLAAIAETHRHLSFAWYTDHHGLSAPLGHSLAQPMPLPASEAAALAVAHRLQALSAALAPIAPCPVGLENAVTGFTFGDPLDEPQQLGHALRLAGGHLLLDLHNVYTMGLNLGFDPRAWIERLDLRQVIEIHISGGAESPVGWLPEGRRQRLDAHSGLVPAAVWDLLAWVLPRCPHLRGVTLERMEGTVGPEDVPVIAADLAHARRLIERHGVMTTPRACEGLAELPPVEAGWRDLERALVQGMCAADPVSALAASLPAALPEALRPPMTQAQADGQRIAALLVAHLRFGRLIRGRADFEAWFDADPQGFTAAFRRYHLRHRPTGHFPTSEARTFGEALAGPSRLD